MPFSTHGRHQALHLTWTKQIRQTGTDESYSTPMSLCETTTLWFRLPLICSNRDASLHDAALSWTAGAVILAAQTEFKNAAGLASAAVVVRVALAIRRITLSGGVIAQLIRVAGDIVAGVASHARNTDFEQALFCGLALGIARAADAETKRTLQSQAAIAYVRAASVGDTSMALRIAFLVSGAIVVRGAAGCIRDTAAVLAMISRGAISIVGAFRGIGHASAGLRIAMKPLLAGDALTKVGASQTGA
jgi:hypothetical protein